MNKRIASVLLLTVGMMLSGVSLAGEGPFAGHTRNWFEAHKKDMAKQINWCYNHGEQKNPAATTCVSALNAKAAIKRKSQKPTNFTNMIINEYDNSKAVSHRK